LAPEYQLSPFFSIYIFTYPIYNWASNFIKRRRKKMKSLKLLVILWVALGLGCGTPYIVGKPIDKAKVDQIVPGTTTESKVVELFGQPTKTESVATGETKYIFSYFEEQPRIWTKNKVIKQTLEVYTRNGVVQKYELKKEGVDKVSAAE